MKPAEYWDCTLGELMLFISAQKKRDNEAWQRSRYEAYTVYCSTMESKSRVSIYEFTPLPDDPTPAEIERIKKKAAIAEQKRNAKKGKQLIKELQKRGLLKID